MPSIQLSGRNAIAVPVSRITWMPQGVVARLLLTMITLNPECYTQTLDGDELVIECDCFYNKLLQYINGNEFRDTLRYTFTLFDTFLVRNRSKYFQCTGQLKQMVANAKTIQDIISAIIQYYAGNPCGLLSHIGAWRVSVSQNSIELYIGDWNNAACRIVNPNITPPFFVVTDFMQGARYFPVAQLETPKKSRSSKSRSKRVVPRGLERKVYLTGEVYALTAAAFAASHVLVQRGATITAYMLTVLEPSRALGNYLRGGIERLREKLGRRLTTRQIGFTDIPEPLLYLAVIDALRAPTGLVELLGVEATSRGRRGDVILELPVELGLSRHLRTVLSVYPELSLVDLVAQVAIDRVSQDEKRKKLASVFTQILYMLAMIAMLVGDPRAEAVEALRLLHDGETISLANEIGGVYRQAVKTLPQVILDSVRLVERLV